MGVLLTFPQPRIPPPAEKENKEVIDVTDDDIDVRRSELDRYLAEDEDTPFNDPWPDHLNK